MDGETDGNGERRERRATEERDVIVVGGGIAGLTAAVFLARADLDTLVIDAGGSILRRNAHLENFPGFPAGVDPRLLLSMTAEQAEEAGCERRDGEVTAVARSGDGFVVETADERRRARHVIAATKNETDYLAGLEGLVVVDRGKTFVDADERGRTGVEGLYAAGRLAGKPHQAVVCAGHGAEVAVTLLEDDDVPFYHDWVTPEGYFTDRGREVPPGCEEIHGARRRERARRSRAAMRERFAEPHPERQETHPSLEE